MASTSFIFMGLPILFFLFVGLRLAGISGARIRLRLFGHAHHALQVLLLDHSLLLLRYVGDLKAQELMCRRHQTFELWKSDSLAEQVRNGPEVKRPLWQPGTFLNRKKLLMDVIHRRKTFHRFMGPH